VIEGYRITRCPLVYVGDTEQAYLQAYYEYKNGFLPNSGGWLDQPAKFSKIVAAIEKIVAQMEQQYGNARPQHTDKA
jgi:hypothetical protein